MARKTKLAYIYIHTQLTIVINNNKLQKYLWKIIAQYLQGWWILAPEIILSKIKKNCINSNHIVWSHWTLWSPSAKIADEPTLRLIEQLSRQDEHIERGPDSESKCSNQVCPQEKDWAIVLTHIKELCHCAYQINNSRKNIL